MQPISIQRVWLLVQRSAMLYGRSSLVYLGPLLGILFIGWSTSNGSNDYASPNNFFNNIYAIIVVVLGFYFSATSLSEHKTADGRQSSLTVPASDTEKFISSWLYTGPIFLIAFSISFFLLSWVVIGVLSIFSITGIPTFNPFESGVLEQVKVFFLVAQPLGLLAAIAFDRYPAAKVIGSVMALAFGLAAMAALTVRIVYREAFEGFFTPVSNLDIGQPNFSVNADSPLILLLVLGLTLLAATYFKFQEKSV